MSSAASAYAPSVTLDVDEFRRRLFISFIEHPPEDDDELHLWIRCFLDTDIPRGHYCPNHVAPFTFVSDLFFERVDFAFGFANRNGGKTWDGAVLNILNIIFKEGIEIVSAGAVISQGQRGYKYVTDMLTALVQKLKIDPRELVRSHGKDGVVLQNGSSAELTTASYNGLNSPHPNKFTLDEVELVWIKYLEQGLCVAGDTLVPTARGMIPVRDVRVGDMVWSWSGTRDRVCLAPVTWSGQTGVRSTLELTFSNGETLICTPEHRILCAGGRYLPARWLTPGREVLGVEVRSVSEAVQRRSAANDRPVRGVLEGNEEGALDSPEMPGLRHEDRRQGDVQRYETEEVSPLSFQDEGESAEGMPGLWEGVAEAVGALSAVSLQVPERGGAQAGLPGQSSAALAGEGPDTRRALDDGSSRCDGSQVRLAGAAWPLGAGLHAQGLACGDRGPRELLAREECEGDRSRQAETEAARERGVYADRGELEKPAHVVELLRVSPGPTIPVYDLTVAENHSFVANGILVHNCMTKEQNGYKAQDILMSTRKVAKGLVQKLLDEAEQRGMKIYPWCIYDIIEKCTRQCKDDPVHGNCPAYSARKPDGTEEILCGGKAHDVPEGGFYTITDFVKKSRTMNRDTWKTEWLNEKPTGGALVYGEFYIDEYPFVVSTAGNSEEYEKLLDRMRHETNWPRVVGVDFGSHFAVEYLAQDPMTLIWYVYHEIYWEPDQDYPLEARTKKIVELDPLGWNPRTLVFCDPAGKQAITDMGAMNLPIDPIGASNDVYAGVNKVKKLLQRDEKDGLPRLRIFSQCKELRKELSETYLHVQEKDGTLNKDKYLKRDDHAADALRYALLSYDTLGTSQYKLRKLRGMW